jgi:hypothetical protein
MVESARRDRPVRIDTERELAVRFDVSRLSIRSAMKALEEEGILLRRQGSGTYVLPRPRFESLHVLVAQTAEGRESASADMVGELTRLVAQEGIELKMVSPGRRLPGGGGVPLVIVGRLPAAAVRELKNSYRHIVATQSYAPSLAIPAVCRDDHGAGFRAAQTLLDRGHVAFAHLAGSTKDATALDRSRGFEAGLETVGRASTAVAGRMSWSGGHASAEVVRDLVRGSEGVSGVFAANDWMALGLIRRLAELGIRVPDDVSVIGCDDVHLATEMTPKLSTFHWDTGRQARAVFDALARMRDTGVVEQPDVRIPAAYVARDTVRTVTAVSAAPYAVRGRRRQTGVA